MRFWRLVIITVIACGPAVFVVGSAAPAGASCVGPSIAVSPTELIRGEPFEITGRFFGTDCNDTGQSGRPLGDPQTGIVIGFAQAGRTARLFTVDAEADYSFRVRTVLPRSADTGAGSLRVTAGDLPDAARTVGPVSVQVRGRTAVPGASPPRPTFLSGTQSQPPRGTAEASTPWWLWASGIAALAAAAAVRFTWFRRSRATAPR